MIHSHHPQLLNINPTPTTVTPGDSAEGLGRAHLLVEPSLANIMSRVDLGPSHVGSKRNWITPEPFELETRVSQF